MLTLWHQLMLWLLFGPFAFSMPAEAESPIRMEIFVSAAVPIPEPPSGVILTVYRIDGLRTLETRLSSQLPLDQDTAQAEAAKRIAMLREADFRPAEEAARGLVRALALGIDRYPAVVIEESAVLYGLQDPEAALARYRDWQTENEL